jgi:CheY-like chemotaxis protein
MPLRGITVLAVDDNEAHNYVLRKTLKKLGSEVVSAMTGTEALALAKQKPTVILLDVNLPDLNGYEICRRLKADEKTRKIPVIFISAISQDAHARSLAEAAGAAGFLFYPLDEERLIAALRGQTVNVRAKKQNRQHSR